MKKSELKEVIREVYGKMKAGSNKNQKEAEEIISDLVFSEYKGEFAFNLDDKQGCDYLASKIVDSISHLFKEDE